MSTVDEVLATAEVVDAVCVIDGETRIISVPTEYKELGVESDEKVTRVKFQCPKIVEDNIDLTEYNLYINYRNADNKLNSYLVEDATVTDDVINFSWLLSRHVTESPGTISYIVCAKKSDYTGVINEWNTKVATGTVGVGLEATEEIEEQNIDIIEQILRSIVELENKVDGGGSGGSGEDGGYYTPAVTQTTEKTMQVSFTPSKTTMPDGYNVQIDPNGTPDGIPKTLPNPHAITFTGAVTGSYDGSAPMTVEIPSGGSGGSSGRFEVLVDFTTEEAVTEFTIPKTVIAPLASKIKEASIILIQLIIPRDTTDTSITTTGTVDIKAYVGWLTSIIGGTFNAIIAPSETYNNTWAINLIITKVPYSVSSEPRSCLIQIFGRKNNSSPDAVTQRNAADYFANFYENSYITVVGSQTMAAGTRFVMGIIA